MEDLKRTVALLFKRKGKTVMSEKEFVFSASMDFRWFPPKDSQKLLQVSIDVGLLTKDDGNVRPTFDLKEVDLPLDFTPSPEMLKVTREDRDIFKAIVDKICRKSDHDTKMVVSRINEVQERIGAYAEVAALLVGRELDVDVSEFYAAVEDLAYKRSR